MDYFSDLEFIFAEYAADAVSHYEDHWFQYYGLQYIHRGGIRVSAGGSPETANGPVLFVTGPGLPFSYQTPDGTRDHYFVCFRGPRAESFVRGGLLEVRSRNLLIPIRDPGSLAARFTSLIRCLHHPGSYGHAEAVIQLEKILLFLAKEQMRTGRDSHRKNLLLLSDAIAADPGQNWDFAGEAAKEGLSLVQFRRIFHEVTGSSPWHYLLECRIKLASTLLLTTGLKIKEIADQCGFQSEFHFSRTYKKYVGYAPADYRKLP